MRHAWAKLISFDFLFYFVLFLILFYLRGEPRKGSTEKKKQLNGELGHLLYPCVYSLYTSP